MNFGMSSKIVLVERCAASNCRCKSGGKWDGGIDINSDGYCTAYCSTKGYCGSTPKYATSPYTNCYDCARGEYPLIVYFKAHSTFNFVKLLIFHQVHIHRFKIENMCLYYR